MGVSWRLRIIFVSCIIFVFFLSGNSLYASDIYPKPVLTVCPSFATTFLLYPRNESASMETGNGFLFGCGVINLFLHNFYTQVSVDMALSDPELESITYNFFYNVLLSLGYQYRIHDSFSLTPLVSSGLFFQDSNDVFFSCPVLTLGIKANMNIVGNHYIYGAFDTSMIFSRTGDYLFKFQIGFLNHYQIIPDIPQKAKAALSVTPRIFTPDFDHHNDLAEIMMTVQSYSKIIHWELTVRNQTQKPVCMWSGKESVPEKIIWDGNLDNGETVSSNTDYDVILLIYDDLDRVTEARAVLTTGALSSVEIPDQATAALRVIPERFSPDGDGYQDEVELWLDIVSFCTITEWSLTILDPHSHPFYHVNGSDQVPEKIMWDGISSDGELVESAMNYHGYLELTDEYNRKTSARAVITTDIIVIKEEDSLNIRIPDITFAPNSTSLFLPDDEDKTTKNMDIINRLVELFSKYKEYSIRIEGHANHLDWYNREKMQKEQEEILLPLSLKRAQAVRDTLVILGIDEKRMNVFGFGGLYPMVPYDDTVNNWKNRRVEFILYKEH